jgi:hypothetical protein
MELRMQGVSVDQPVVFELTRAGGSVGQEVEIRMPAGPPPMNPEVRVEPATTPEGFVFEASRPHWREHPDYPGHQHLHVEVTCSGGREGAEDRARLLVTFPGGEVVPVELIASVNHTAPFSQVLCEEYRELRPDWAARLDTISWPPEPPPHDEGQQNDPVLRRAEDAALRQLHDVAHAAPEGLAALCLSGGGIRSATFNLGILQALASLGLLDKFHYLSTVSGGGYIGSWLSGWIHREGRDKVLADLAGTQPTPTRPEPEPIRHLRQYSNYLNPRLGLFSADTWTLAAIVLRNLLLNWLVILPVLAALLAVPLLAISEIPGYGRGKVDSDLLFGLAFGLGLMGLFFMSLLRASRQPGGAPGGSRRWEQWFLPLGLAPLLAGTICLILAVPLYNANGVFTMQGVLGRSAMWGLVMPLLALLLSAAVHPLVFPGRPRRTSLPVDVFAVSMSGAVVTLIYAGMLSKWAPSLLQPEARPFHLYEIFGPGLVLGPLLLGKMLFIAFASPAEEWWKERLSEQGDADREWWARWTAWILIVNVSWIFASSLVYFAPLLLAEGFAQVGALLGAGGLGGLTAWLGRSAETGSSSESSQPGGWRKWALALAAPLFCVLLLLLVSASTQALLDLLSERQTVSPVDAVALEVAGPPEPDSAAAEALGATTDAAAKREPGWITDPSAAPPFQGPLWTVLAAIAVLFGFANVMGYFVNVNRFSLQGMYRNRLVRAYLGASHARRSPNPFTGFDWRDNLRLHHLRRNRPLHVIGATLNLVGGQDLAWQQRKATSFTASPLHCGSAGLGFRRSQNYGGRHGLTLGSAIATSGAAANPSMGHYSSGPITFIMTLFNARLGAWAGNPGKVGRTTFSRSGPRFSSRVIFEESMGMTDADHPYVNLSDGGHFENLGIYEMVRRRCRFIVVGDAGSDPSCEFEDLGNALRKIRIDFGVSIDFEGGVRVFPKPKDEPPKTARYCAVGTINYADVDGPDAKPGTLIYIKPAICRQEPYDVYNYSKSSAEFPHESTADQWFSESQFESYRALARSATLTMAGKGGRPADLAEFATRVERYIAGTEEPPTLLEQVGQVIHELGERISKSRQIGALPSPPSDSPC